MFSKKKTKCGVCGYRFKPKVEQSTNGHIWRLATWRN